MFGQNQIVGLKEFKEVEDKLLVTSIFYTLQGEGPYAGMPAVFVRLAKCNLACNFCDTYFDHGEWLSFDELNARIEQAIMDHFSKQGMETPDWALKVDITDDHERYISHPGIVLVVTGGEPMLQHQALDRWLFSMQMGDVFSEMQIETNGLIKPVDGEDGWDGVTFVCSPKCSEKNGAVGEYLKPQEDILDRATALKFVVSADPASPYHRVPQWAIDWAIMRERSSILVSPMNVYEKPALLRRQAGVQELAMEELTEAAERVSFWTPDILDRKANQANHEYAAALCMRHGFKLNLQTHLYASIP